MDETQARLVSIGTSIGRMEASVSTAEGVSALVNLPFNLGALSAQRVPPLSCSSSVFNAPIRC